MSNFISESERHEELYLMYSKRHQEVLSDLSKIQSETTSDDKFEHELLNRGVSCSEIEWLKRTGHYYHAIA